MICIDEEMASKVGLEAAAVYYYMRLILCTKMYQESFKGCMVKRDANIHNPHIKTKKEG